VGYEVLVDAPDGMQFLDMNQEVAGGLGGVTQVVAANQGASYTLTLDITAWARNSVGGSVGYELYDPTSNAVLASGSYKDDVRGAWITRTLTATATSAQIAVRIHGLVATNFLDLERTIEPRAGMALLFQHRLLHEGSEVTDGVKYVVRSDVMYRARPSGFSSSIASAAEASSGDRRSAPGAAQVPRFFPYLGTGLPFT